MEIITNNQPRDLLYDIDQETDYFVYKGNRYNINEVEVAPASFKGWNGIVTESFFSGILVKWVDNYEGVIVGRYYC
jgi:hypothetical protein